MAAPFPLVLLAPNRVRRNYLGGYLLDRMEGRPLPRDGHQPEDWLASSLRAVNPGLEEVPNEGLAHVRTPTGEPLALQELFDEAPDFYFGPEHVLRRGPKLGFLAKLLDSSMRLHVQAHPTAAFAQAHLGSPHGKLEAYVILALRDEKNAHLRLGFQRPPSPEEWKRIVLEQDIAAMDACFDRIPIRVGEGWLVPGGLPHAIGEGVLMLEVMEPSDLVVRCEFERKGVVVPPEARFMESPVDVALQIFDYTPLSVADVQARYRIAPQKLGPDEELLIGPAQTSCFSVTRLTIPDRRTIVSPGQLRLGVVAAGEGSLAVEGHTVRLQPGARFLLAASAPPVEVQATGGPALQLLFCAPGI
jgi:mannose-6-phosphate isomerase